MKDSALSVANYFVDKSLNGAKDLKPLKLMKLVYIAHGYMLALYNESALNPRFDKVEAWKYGPVIPSVYHSFKIYGNQPITKKTEVFSNEIENDGNITIELSTPELEDEKARKTCDFVWKNYNHYSDSALVDLLHKKGSPWALVYEEGKNNEIPDIVTRVYYRKIVDRLLQKED